MEKIVNKVSSFLNRFKVNKGATILLIVIFVICLCVYGFLCYLTNLETGEQVVINNKLNLVTINTVKEILIGIISVIGIDLIFSLVTEVRSNNKMLSDFFKEDIISSPDFYLSLEPETRQKMLKALEQAQYYNDNEPLYMVHSNVIKKLQDYKKDDYYFEKCEYIVRVTDRGDFFEKRIVRNIRLKSYDHNKVIKYFRLGRITCAGENNDKFQISEVVVNKNPIAKSRIIKSETDVEDKLNKKNGYKKEITYSLDKIKLSKDTDVTISVKIITVCPKDDLVSAFRATVPCKNFSVDYVIEDPENKYRVVAHAFGFMDHADSYPNNHKDNGVKIELNGWTLRDNGITITTIQKPKT